MKCFSRKLPLRKQTRGGNTSSPCDGQRSTGEGSCTLVWVSEKVHLLCGQPDQQLVKEFSFENEKVAERKFGGNKKRKLIVNELLLILYWRGRKI